MNSEQEIFRFWFEELSPKDWWKKSEELDREIEKRFGRTLKAAALAECYQWRNSAEGRLAEIIVLDQLSRNIYRDRPESFAQDPLALVLAQYAISLNDHRILPSSQAAFVAMPYMHSESPIIHRQAVEVFTQIGKPDTLKFELKHKKIIDQFGRYPHRNRILGRSSSAEEAEFLSTPGSSF